MKRFRDYTATEIIFSENICSQPDNAVFTEFFESDFSARIHFDVSSIASVFEQFNFILIIFEYFNFSYSKGNSVQYFVE